MTNRPARVRDVTNIFGPPPKGLLTVDEHSAPPKVPDRRHRADRALPETFRWTGDIDGTPGGHAGVAALVAAAGGSRELLGELVASLASSARAAIVGPAGAGKTSIACAALHAHIMGGGRGLFVPAWRLALAPSRSPLGEEAQLVTRATETQLLVLDNLGDEPAIATSAVAEVIFERHLAGRRTWVTLACRPQDIGARYGDGLARRLFEGAWRATLPTVASGRSGKP